MLKKTRRCKICKNSFTPRFSMKQPTCENPECVIENRKKEKEKEEKKRRQDWAKEKKERKEKIKTHSEWLKDLERPINKIARLIDKDCTCISCGAQTTAINKAQAGHRWSVKGYPNIRYNLFNIHLQGVCCNKHHSGNGDGYDEGIKRIYGHDWYEYIYFTLRAKYTSCKMSIPEIKEAIATANQIIKELESLNMAYPPKVRIELRKKYNERLGIYK